MRNMNHLFLAVKESSWIVVVRLSLHEDIPVMMLLGEKSVACYDSERKTLRCDDCMLLIDEGDDGRCRVCEEYRQTLNLLLDQQQNSKTVNFMNYELQTMPNGGCRCLQIMFISFVHYTPAQSSSNKLCFLKCEEELSGNFQMPLSVMINGDMSWEATVLGTKLLPSSEMFSSLPQVVRAVTDIETALNFVDCCSICVGNPDEKYEPLVSCRNGKFMDSSGKSFTALRHSYYDVTRREKCGML